MNRIEKFKKWRLEKIRQAGQWYADLIIRSLENAKSEWEFDFWLIKGCEHDFNMVNKYGIYLD
jgi:hypothetical protein